MSQIKHWITPRLASFHWEKEKKKNTGFCLVDEKWSCCSLLPEEPNTPVKSQRDSRWVVNLRKHKHLPPTDSSSFNSCFHLVWLYLCLTTKQRSKWVSSDFLPCRLLQWSRQHSWEALLLSSDEKDWRAKHYKHSDVKATFIPVI